jgi:hypothetical protein
MSHSYWADSLQSAVALIAILLVAFIIWFEAKDRWRR